MTEDAGSIYAEIRLGLDQINRDGIDAQKKMDQLANRFRQQGTTAGKGFANGMKQGFDNVENNAARLGRSIAAKLSPALLAIGAGIKIFQGIGSAIKEAFNSNERFANSMNDLKSALGASFSTSVKPVSDFFANLIEKAGRSVRQTRELREALERIRTENFTDVNKDLPAAIVESEKGFNLFQTRYLEFQNQVNDISRRLNNLRTDTFHTNHALIAATEEELARVINLRDEAGRNMTIYANNLNTAREIAGNASIGNLTRLQEVEDEYNNTLIAITFQYKELERLLGNSDELRREQNEARISALNNFINKTSEIISLGQEEEIQNSIHNQNLQKRILLRRQLQNSLNIEITDQQRINDARIAAIQKYEHAKIRAREAEKAGLIEIEEMERRIQAARQTKYDDLQSIILQYNLKDDAVTELRDSTADLLWLDQELAKSRENKRKIEEMSLSLSEEWIQQQIISYRAAAEAADSEEARQHLIQRAIELELELFDAQRQRQWDAIKNSDEFITALEEERIAIQRNFDLITESRRNALQKIDAENETRGSFLERLFGSEKFGNIMQVGQSALDVFSSISEGALEIARRHAQEQLAIIDKTLKTTLESIERARKDHLIYMGFMEADTVESLETRLEAAKESGDQQLIFLAHSRLEEQKINDQYDELARQAEEAAAKEKAKIEFELAKREHRNKMINAANYGAMAILQALASAPPPINAILAGITGVLTAVQIGFIASNPPKMPTFSSGGIVPGNSYFGDRIIGGLNSDEMVLTKQHQRNLFNRIDNNDLGGNQEIIIHHTMILDGLVIVKNTTKHINNRQVLIDGRSVLN